jgi:methylmalonyl-CoA mutase, N-terminal domain
MSHNGATGADLALRLAERDRELAELKREVEAWRKEFGRLPLREDADFTSISGRTVEPVYTPVDLVDTLGGDGLLPGSFPYTRGIHPSMYRGRLWTMRLFSGFGTAIDTNRRYQFLLPSGARPGSRSPSTFRP